MTTKFVVDFGIIANALIAEQKKRGRPLTEEEFDTTFHAAWVAQETHAKIARGACKICMGGVQNLHTYI